MRRLSINVLKPLKKSFLRKQESILCHEIPAFAGMTCGKWHFFRGFVLSLLLMIFLIGCIESGGPKMPKKVIIPGGTNDPTLGLTVDASYDKRLDSLAPGYKIVTVACSNTSMDVFVFDILADKWWIEDASGRRIKAIVDLRRYAPNVWSNLIGRAKELIEYPLNLRIGETRVIELFVSDRYDVSNFRSVIFYCAAKGQTYQILAR